MEVRTHRSRDSLRRPSPDRRNRLIEAAETPLAPAATRGYEQSQVLQAREQSPVAAIEGKLTELDAQHPHVDYELHLMLTDHAPTAHHLVRAHPRLGLRLPAYLRAAHITSIDSWYACVPLLPDLPFDEYSARVRGTTDPFVASGRLLDGQPWPAPAIPLRDDTNTPPRRTRRSG